MSAFSVSGRPPALSEVSTMFSPSEKPPPAFSARRFSRARRRSSRPRRTPPVLRQPPLQRYLPADEVLVREPVTTSPHKKAHNSNKRKNRQREKRGALE